MLIINNEQQCSNEPPIYFYSVESEDEQTECNAHQCTIATSRTRKIRWIQCDDCARWFHFHCLGLSMKTVKDNWICPMCA